MYFNLEWISHWLDQALDIESIAERLTMAGLEIDSVTTLTHQWDNVVTARIIKITPHPQADRLNICTVDSGDSQSHLIVCGAPNIYEGMCVPFAKIGAELSDVKIKAAKIRGVESKGMLCSATELGLGDDSSGLFDLGEVELGCPLTEYILTNDKVYKIDLTPNRGDCWSILGVARELAIIYQCNLKEQEPIKLINQGDCKQKIVLNETQSCPVYLSSIITDLDCTKSAPLWLRERIRRCGVRSIHPVVDILNYVMLELGQPMHAFDWDKVEGELIIRYAKKGESITVIGGQCLELTDTDLVICDTQRVHALAGVIGAEHSAVTGETKKVILECAFFAPQAISGTARRHKLQTEASQRFERGVDPHIQNQALTYAMRLINDHIGGQLHKVVIEGDSSSLDNQSMIVLHLSVFQRCLGVLLDEEFIEKSLLSIGCKIKKQSADVWECMPPSWRFDLKIEEDLIEEVGRIYGYDNIEEKFDLSITSFPNVDKSYDIKNQFLQTLINSGYYEVVAYSMTDRKLQEMFSNGDLVHIKNPISKEMEVMCISLLPGLLQALSYNLRRQYSRVRLFQTDKIFVQQGEKVIEHLSLAGVACGNIFPEQWTCDKSQSDFYSVKGDVERVLSPLDDIAFIKSEDKALHPYRSASIMYKDLLIGCVGQLSPQLESIFKIKMPVVLFELNLSLIPALDVQRYQPISTQPSVRRDIAITIKNDVSVGDLVECIKNVSSEVLQDVITFDIFTGRTVESGYKSVALGLIFQSLERTLTKEDIDILIDKIIEQVIQFGGSLRTE